MSTDVVMQWITGWGSFGLFPLLALGIVGLPIPDETLLASAGFLVARGDLHVLPTILFAFFGSVLGITLSYALGRLGGKHLLERYGHIIHFDEPRRAALQKWFARWGKWGLIVCYFIPGIRHFGALLAGISKLHYPPFAVFAYIGALMWTTTFICAGYLLEHEWEHIHDVVRPHLVGIGLTIGATLLLAFVTWLLFRYRSQ